MKKMFTILIVLLFAVVVHLKVGVNVKADRIVRYTNNGVVVEKGNKRTYVPNYNIIKVTYDKNNDVVE